VNAEVDAAGEVGAGFTTPTPNSSSGIVRDELPASGQLNANRTAGSTPMPSADTVAGVDTPPTSHDVFLSFSGADRHRVDELADALAKAGVRPFVDDRGIRFAHSITGEIQDALRTSKTMLLYYSASFPQRSACQFELRHAYLSALRAGEVEQRILVVNPEDPDTDHLMPLEMRSHRYWKTWNSQRELAELVARIRTAVDGVDTPFPAIDFSSRATVHSRPTEPIADFVGRYRDRWMIHSALHRGDYPLTETVTSQPVAGLTGMTGMGKTSLAKVYVHDFGFLYPGHVHWTDLTGAGTTPDQVRATHTARLLELAEQVDSPLPGRSRRQVLQWWNNYLAAKDGPVLWVVDDVPGPLPLDVLAELVPQASGVHTLLIGQHEFPPELAEPVRVRALTADDGRELFLRHRAPFDDDLTAVDEVVDRLGGHPYAIRFAAAGARGSEGLWDLRDRVEHLTSDASVLDRALETVRLAIADRRGAERVVLSLSAVCAADPLPAVLIRDVLAEVDPADHERANAVLAGMDQAMLVEQVDGGSCWQVHQLVRETAKQTLSAAELDTVARIAARELIALAELGTPSLVGHATTLLERTTDSPALSTALNSLAAKHYDLRGEPSLAAPFHENLHALHPEDPGHVLDAARARQAAGHHDRALDHVEKLTGLTDDALMSLRAAHVRGAVLDARGQHREAEEIWARLVNSDVLRTAPPEEQTAVRTAHLRNRRTLGYFAEARSLAHDLLATTDDRQAEELIPARLELVAIGMATDDRHGARTTAQEIVDHYARRGLPRHINAIEAATLLHEAQLEVHILEKFPDPKAWVTAEAELRELLAATRESLGRTNSRTLTIAVAHLRVMVGLGDPDRALEEYSDLPAELAEHLGAEHRLHLRAVFLLGQAHAQRDDEDNAIKAYRRALAGQEVSLGPGHPETLRTRYELGVMWWLTGKRSAATAAFDSVRRDAVEEVGRRNDLYGQALVGGVLSRFLPGFAVRAVHQYDRSRRKH
jgi:tetratricopeptide (TPR) repeat protein